MVDCPDIFIRDHLGRLLRVRGSLGYREPALYNVDASDTVGVVVDFRIEAQLLEVLPSDQHDAFEKHCCLCMDIDPGVLHWAASIEPHKPEASLGEQVSDDEMSVVLLQETLAR